ncbi:Tetratricopeptide repeat protein [Candidatus Burarchaeum australiense]|nr:Tetratricopeptide repeat protein [Candidatus Burarchaeum australiense]
MSGKLGITYGMPTYGMLWESLITKKYDCDNSATMAFDVAARIGIPVGFVIVPEHTLICTEDFRFESTTQTYSSIFSLEESYPSVTAIITVFDHVAADQVAYYNRGLARSDLGDSKGAMADYTAVIGINPKYVEAYYNRGIEKYNMNNLRGAIRDYNVVIRIRPDYADAYYNRGIARSALGNSERAKEDFAIYKRLKRASASKQLVID